MYKYVYLCLFIFIYFINIIFIDVYTYTCHVLQEIWYTHDIHMYIMSSIREVYLYIMYIVYLYILQSLHM